MGKMIEQIWIRKNQFRVPSFELVNQIWTRSADHHTGQRLLENAAIKGLTEDRARSPALRFRNFLLHGRQPQRTLR